MRTQLQDGFGSFTVDTKRDVYSEPNKQILVVMGGVRFVSEAIGAHEARHLLRTVQRLAPCTDPMIVVAN